MLVPAFNNFLNLLAYYAPGFLGTLLVLYSLKYMRHFSQGGEGNKALSYAFLLLTIKNGVAIVWQLCVGQSSGLFFLTSIILSLQTAASLFFILAGIQVAHIPYLKKDWMPYITTLSILAVFYIMILGKNNALKMILPTLTLSLSAFFLVLCYVKEIVFHKSISLKWLAIGFGSFAVWNLLKSLPIGQMTNWSMEISLYAFILFCIFYTSAQIIQQQFELLEYEAFSSKSRLRLILQSLPFPTIITRLKDDKITLFNQDAADFFKMDPKKKYHFYDCFSDILIRRNILERLDKTPVLHKHEIKIKTPAEKILEVSARIIDFENEISLFLSFQDVTEQRKKAALLYEQATEDELTTCFNRRHFMSLAEKELARFWRYHGSFSLLIADIDNFKSLNDTYGHQTGDMVLRAVGSCWKKLLRASDIIGRLGGDEFAFILPETDAQKAVSVAKRLQEAVSLLNLTATDGTPLNVQISIGITLSSPMNDLEKTLHLADEALYSSKRNGKNKITLSGNNILENPAYTKQESRTASRAIDSIVDETLDEINNLLSSVNKPKIANLSNVLKSNYMNKDKGEDNK